MSRVTVATIDLSEDGALGVVFPWIEEEARGRPIVFERLLENDLQGFFEGEIDSCLLIVGLGKKRYEACGGFEKCLEGIDKLMRLRRRVRTILVSSQPFLDAAEAQRAWIGIPALAGYFQAPEEEGAPRLKNAITKETVQGEMRGACTLIQQSPSASRRTVEVGSLVPLPEPDAGSSLEARREIYRENGFASLMTGGLEQVLAACQRALQAVEEQLPATEGAQFKIAGKGYGHPFRDDNANSVFGKYVEGKHDPLLEALGTLWQRPVFLTHILITGPTGSGKSELARHLHRSRLARAKAGCANITPKTAREEAEKSLDKSLPFRRINCGAIPPTLAVNEIFGATKGAHNAAADRAIPGRVFESLMGTLFLDEIGDLHPEAQPILLHYLDNFEYLPLGPQPVFGPIVAPTMIVAATNRRIEEEGEDFRRDLLARFRVRIQMPGLDERKEKHLAAIVDYMLQNPDLNRRRPEGGRWVNAIEAAAIDRLRGVSWEDRNFRDLERILSQAVRQADADGRDWIAADRLNLSRMKDQATKNSY